MSDILWQIGGGLLLGLLRGTLEANTRQRELEHQQQLEATLARDLHRTMRRESERVQLTRAALEDARCASADPRWQKQIDLLLHGQSPNHP